MASASEGKTLATSTKNCDICKNNVSYKYCSECCMMLCRNCTDNHLIIPALKHHNLSDLTASRTSPMRKLANAQQEKCPKHDKLVLNNLCQNCSLLICDSCLPDHRGHEVQPLRDDLKICQKLCTKQIQQLLDELQEAEEIKSILESNITTYDEAAKVVDKWELDILQIVKTKAAGLRQKLKTLKDGKSILLSDKVDGLLNKIKEINKTITKLNDTRQGMNIQVLTNELSRSQELITKLQSFKDELQPLPKKLDVKEFVKTGNKIKDVESDIDILFSIADIQDTTTPNISKTPNYSAGIKPNPSSPAQPSPVMSVYEMARLIRPGARVVRGADWRCGDSHGPPTMIGTVTKGLYSGGLVKVTWDHGGEHTYCMGRNGQYELKLA